MRFLNVTVCRDFIGLSVLSLFFATITPVSTHAEPMADFSLRYSNNLKGNIKTIGNTLMQASPASTSDNGSSNMVYVDIDSNANTFNSSSADINATENGLDITTASVVWAGLYWQGYLHTWDTSDGPNINDQYTNLTTLQSIASIVDSHSILFTTPTGTYSISPDALGKRTNQGGNGAGYDTVNYGAFANVTSLLAKTSLTGTYTVANVPTQQGKTSNSGWYDGLGNYGAWTLVVIYDNHASVLEKTRNFSVYDGYITLSGSNDPTNPLNTDADIIFTGFKTPKVAPNGVDSVISIFAGEGDARIGTTWGAYDDSASIFSQDGDKYDLPTPPGRSNYFSSAIDGVPIRNPIIDNNKGIDIHVQQIGTIDGNDRPIKINHTSATLNLKTRYDTYMPSMVSFATELYVPEICYDYTIQQNGFDITDNGENPREFQTTGAGEVTINIAIKSKEGDFDFENSKLNFELDPRAYTTFSEALYAPNNVNTFIPALYSAQHTNSRPSIAIGELPTTNGGSIKALQRYFSKFKYRLTSNTYAGKFEFDLNTTIDFGSGPVPLSFSTRSNTVDRCDLTKKYNPTYGSFNVERHESHGAPNEKYPLYTQVVGRDFDFDIVSYKKDPAPAYSSEISLNGYTVDIELINVHTFNDQNETFTCTNPDASIIQAMTADGEKQLFAKFTGSTRVSMGNLNIQTDTALRSAAFRVWYIVDANNSVIPHNCSDPLDNACFQELYNTHLESTDITLQASETHGFCTVDTLGAGGCSSYSNPQSGTSGCYACLRDFFSKAVCSRDNFSIRPAAYRMSISDSNESITATNTTTLGTNNMSSVTDAVVVAAGYQYKLDGNATSFLSDSIIALGYTRIFDNSDTNSLSSLVLFKDQPACYDQNDTAWNISFINSRISGIIQNNDTNLSFASLVRHSNVGGYAYNLHDSNWTIVDQQRYVYKTFPGIDDCIPNNNSIVANSFGKSGCDIDSKLTSNSGLNNPIYSDLLLQYEPYKFDLSDINFSTKPAGQDVLFMTDFDNPYYDTPASLSRTMAAVYKGNITALSKDNIKTTNFTNNCSANNLTIRLTRNTYPTEDNLSNEYNVKMQQYLQYGSDIDLQTSFDEKKIGQDANLTLAKAAFEDSQIQGSARVRIYTTFKKPKKDDIPNGGEGVNPITVNYLDINAFGYDANSSANMSMHIPKGTENFDQNITFVYGRVVPRKRLYIEKENGWIMTPLYINIYCSYGIFDCKNRYDLNTSSLSDNLGLDNWYQADNIFN